MQGDRRLEQVRRPNPAHKHDCLRSMCLTIPCALDARSAAVGHAGRRL